MVICQKDDLFAYFLDKKVFWKLDHFWIYEDNCGLTTVMVLNGPKKKN